MNVLPAEDRAAARRRHAGFALVEVLIAAVLLVLVSGAFLQLVVGSSQAQASVKVRQKQQAVAEGLVEQLRVDSSWTKDCTEAAAEAGSLPDACVVEVGDKYRDADFTKDPTTGARFAITATATAVDSAGDGRGAADKDGSPVDFFQVETTVSAPDGTNVGDLSSTSVVDPFSDQVTGSFNLDVCAMPVQVDERLVVSSCETDLPMDASTVDAADRAAFDALPAARRVMQVDPVSSLVRLRGLDALDGEVVEGRTDAQGKLTVGKLKPGRYVVTVVSPPAGLELWASKSIPESIISVEPYQSIDGMMAYRREAAPDYKILLQTSTQPVASAGPIDFSKHTLGIEGRDVRVRLLPMPAGRVPVATTNAVATYTNSVMTSLTIPEPAPGLYRAMVVNGSGGLEPLYRSNRGVKSVLANLWIGTPSVPAGADVDRDGNIANDDAAYYIAHKAVAGTPTPPSATPGAPTSVPPVNTGPDSFTNTFPYVPAASQPLGCSWRTPVKLRRSGFLGLGPLLPPLLATETNPGVRTCAPCGSITVNHDALGSTVNIRCGQDASCRQSITFSDGSNWGIGTLKGGVLDVQCYQNANCTQSATVAGNRNSTFVCYPNSECNQQMPATRTWSGPSAGGSAEVHCFTQARCTQVGYMPPGATTLARCFPDARCDQRILDGFTWSSSGSQLAMECHPKSTCRQTSGKTRWSFSTTPAGMLKMVCRAEAACDQAAFLGSFAAGFDMICNERGACRQTLILGMVSGKADRRESRQSCYPAATCSQFLDRTNPALKMDQTCYPPDGNQAAAEAAVGPACNLNGTRINRGWLNISVESTRIQYCATGSTCTMNMVSGGWGSFDGYAPYRQLCVARDNCVQNATRDADWFSGVTAFSQDCQTSGGSCKQVANIRSTTRGTLRRQVCDSRTSCTQDMYNGTVRARLTRDASGRIIDVDTGLSFGGTAQDVFQLCNRAITDAPPAITTIEPEPEGTFDSTGGGTGGA